MPLAVLRNPHVDVMDALIDFPYRYHGSPLEMCLRLYRTDYMDALIDYMDPLIDLMDLLIDPPL